MRISVVIPAFDVEPWVASAVESALHQDPPPHDVIVVDDGSTDATGAIAGSYAGVRVIRQENRGLAAARNAGAAAATGDAVFFLDADDALLPRALSALSRAASRVPNWAAVIPNYLPEGPGADGLAWPCRPAQRVLSRRHSGPLIRANQLTPNALVRREAWRRHPFHEELRACEDLDFWLRLVLAGERLVVVGDPLVRKRIGRPGALSNRSTLMRESRRLVFESLWARDDLTARERLLVAYQLLRVSAGEAAARREAGEGSGSARSGLARSVNPLVRATGLVLATPGLLPAIGLLDGRRRRP